MSLFVEPWHRIARAKCALRCPACLLPSPVAIIHSEEADLILGGVPLLCLSVRAPSLVRAVLILAGISRPLKRNVPHSDLETFLSDAHLPMTVNNVISPATNVLQSGRRVRSVYFTVQARDGTSTRGRPGLFASGKPSLVPDEKA